MVCGKIMLGGVTGELLVERIHVHVQPVDGISFRI